MAGDVSLVLPKVGGNDQQTQLQTYFVNAKVRLCKAPVPLGPGTVIGDLTAIEADYTGYAAKTVAAWAGPYDTAGGGSSLLSSLLSFSPTGTAVGNSIYGGWVESAGGVLQFMFALDAPEALNGPTDVLPLVIEPRLPGPGVAHVLD